MESIQESLSNMMNIFQTRMADFEAQVDGLKKPNAPPTVANSVDNIEMHSRRKFLLLHGVAEDKHEDIKNVLVDVIHSKLKLNNFSTDSIRHCHRMGQPRSTQSPRPILFMLDDVIIRDKIWFLKTKLKGSGITMSEFLTKCRHDFFMAARTKVGITNCWTKGGSVYVLGNNNTRKRVTSLSDLDVFTSQDIPNQATTSIKTRRAATTTKK